MTDTSTPPHVLARPGRQPYDRPEVVALGRLAAVTSGPVTDQNKNLDQLFGGSGGFARADAVS
jgi:hypothetical protein